MNCSCMAIISIVRIGLAGGGGGVLRAVKSHLTCFRRSDLETDMEMLACLIYTRPAFCLLFSVFYRPPGQNLDFSAKFGAFPNNYSSTNISNLIVLGDFNFPHIDWRTSTSYVSDPDAADFCCLIQDHFLLQVNSNITRYSANSTDSGNILDLVLAKNNNILFLMSLFILTVLIQIIFRYLLLLMQNSNVKRI